MSTQNTTPDTVLAEVARLSELERNDNEAYLDLLFSDQIHTGYPCVDKPWYKYFEKEQMRPSSHPEMKIFDFVRSHPERTDGNTAFSYYGHEISFMETFKHVEECMKVLTDMGVKKGDRILCLVPNVPEAAYLFLAAAQLGAVSDYTDPRPDSPDLLVAARKMLSLFKDEKCKYVISLDSCYLAMVAPNEQEWKDAGLEKVLIFTAADSMNLKAKMTYAKWDKLMHGKEAFDAKMAKQKELQKMFDDCKAKSILDIRMLTDEVKRCKHVEVTEAEYEHDLLCLITHTSGSTGRPKPVPFTHYNLNINAEQICRTQEFSLVPGKTRSLHILPYFAAYGVANILYGGLVSGVTCVEIPEIGTNDFGTLLYLTKSTFCAGIPAWPLSMVDDPFLQDKDLSFVEWLSCGGTAMTAKQESGVNDFLKDHGSKCVLVQGYGCSEIGGSGGHSCGEYQERGTIGCPHVFTTYAIIDPETREMISFKDGDEEIVGELAISVPAESCGQLDGKVYSEHAEYFGKDYVLTGDVVHMRKSGVVYFGARTDRGFARFDGFNVKVDKLEEVIGEFDPISACVVTSYLDENVGGKMVRAHCVLKPGVTLSTDEQVALVQKIVDEGFIQNEDMSARQIPVKFLFREDFPLTGIGKINYNALEHEELTGQEITVKVDETNVSLGNITVLAPEN